MSEKKVKLRRSEKEKRQKRKIKILRLSLLVIILLLINIYILLGIWYNDSKFTITLDSENGELGALLIYEDPEDKSLRRSLTVSNDMKFFTDIAEQWIPKDIDNEKNGSHNGQYYIAYTFYVENSAQYSVDYWTEIDVKDVTKNVDEAVRVKIYKNGVSQTFAKSNQKTGEPEENTVAFYSEEEKKEIIMLEENADFQADAVDKYTVVIWVEGNDPDCLDDIVNGEIKMSMTVTEVLQENEDEKSK